MATKDELIDENAALRAKVAELEAAAAMDAVDGVDEAGEVAEAEPSRADEWARLNGMDFEAYDGVPVLVDAIGRPHMALPVPEGGLPAGVPFVTGDNDGLIEVRKFEVPVAVEAHEDALRRLDELNADVQRLEVERNDALATKADAERRLADAGKLHGSIDSLKAPH